MALIYIALFTAPRAQIAPVIHSFHSFTPICAKWPLTPPLNINLHTYGAMEAKCLAKDTTETEIPLWIFLHVEFSIFVDFCVYISISVSVASFTKVKYKKHSFE